MSITNPPNDYSFDVTKAPKFSIRENDGDRIIGPLKLTVTPPSFTVNATNDSDFDSGSR